MSTEAIVPRWEWRTFGSDFGPAEAVFAGREPDRVHESDETYVLAAGDGDTVKVRDALMDVKHLERVDDRGLEQWLPVMKAQFPLAADGVRSILQALRVDVPPLSREAYTLSQLLEEVVEPEPALLAVDVHKHRVRYTIGGCISELTDVRANGESTRTVALELEDPDRVLAAVSELGLEDRPNVSYPRGLKTLLGFG